MARTRLAKDSVFRVEPRNILGWEHQRFKSKLLALALALAEPASYFRFWDSVYTAIVEEAVGDAYNLYWNILKDGKKKETEAPIKITTEKLIGGTREFIFVPNLPESEINTFALEVAEAVKDIAERCIEKIMPMEIKDLAVRRSKEILPDV